MPITLIIALGFALVVFFGTIFFQKNTQTPMPTNWYLVVTFTLIAFLLVLFIGWITA